MAGNKKTDTVKKKMGPSWPPIYPKRPQRYCLSAFTREAIFEEYGERCAYCGFKLLRLTYYKYDNVQLTRYLATIDHIQPQAKGGTHDPENLVPCCKWCNETKGAKSVEEFRQTLLDNEYPELLNERYVVREEIYGKVFELDWGGKFYNERRSDSKKIKKFRLMVDWIEDIRIEKC